MFIAQTLIHCAYIHISVAEGSCFYSRVKIYSKNTAQCWQSNSQATIFTVVWRSTQHTHLCAFWAVRHYECSERNIHAIHCSECRDSSFPLLLLLLLLSLLSWLSHLKRWAQSVIFITIRVQLSLRRNHVVLYAFTRTNTQLFIYICIRIIHNRHWLTVVECHCTECS